MRMRLAWLVISAPLALTIGCGDDDAVVASDAGIDAGVDDDAGADAGIDAGTWPRRDAGPSSDAGIANLTLDEQLGASNGCTLPSACTADYLRFPTLAETHARPATDADIQAQLDAIAHRTVSVVTANIGDDALRDAILDGLNARFLFEGVRERPLRVSTTARRTTAAYEETSLLFDDPYVGRFEALLLSPVGGVGPYRGLVALHGHGGDAASYRDDLHGGEWPARGYVILILTLRAMNIDSDEHETTRTLLQSGFHLIALRAYEAVLAQKYLASRADVDPARIGLIGHSGGSSTSNLVVRIAGGFAALVSDHAVDWYMSGFEAYHCETAPPIYPYNRLITDLSTSPVPALRVPYGYTDGMAPIFAFFDEHL